MEREREEDQIGHFCFEDDLKDTQLVGDEYKN
jgi:hypothetical protein